MKIDHHEQELECRLCPVHIFTTNYDKDAGHDVTILMPKIHKYTNQFLVKRSSSIQDSFFLIGVLWLKYETHLF